MTEKEMDAKLEHYEMMQEHTNLDSIPAVKRNGTIKGKHIYVIKKVQDGKISYLCDEDNPTVINMILSNKGVSHEKKGFVLWSDVLDATVFTPEEIDSAIHKLETLSKDEFYRMLIHNNEIFVQELEPSFKEIGVLNMEDVGEYWDSTILLLQKRSLVK